MYAKCMTVQCRQKKKRDKAYQSPNSFNFLLTHLTKLYFPSSSMIKVGPIDDGLVHRRWVILFHLS